MRHKWDVINRAQYYVQKKGLAMGTKMVPSYACLFVGYVEEKMLLTYTGTKPIMSRRYIDDYVCISTSRLVCFDV